MHTAIQALVVAGIASTLIACTTASTAPPPPAAASQQGLAKVQVPASVRALAAAPKPPANATTGTTTGSGKLRTSTADGSGDQDSVWVDQIDITGDGQVEDTQFLWDDEDKILFLSSAATFACTNGGEGAGALLIGLYGPGNTDQQPVGSGIWAVELDATECAAQSTGIFGCAFDADGNSTACGVAVLNAQTGELVIGAAAN
jgi:hypothetical protein